MHMKLLCLNIACVAALTVASCSKRPAVDAAGKGDSPREHSEENGALPEKEDIGEDCVGFLRSTVSNRIDGAGQCPVCPSSADKAEVLGVDSVSIEKVNMVGAGGTSCEANVQIRAHFNPSNGGTITGGLVGWIPAEQRTQYTRGTIPSGQQVYHVMITYRREGDEWQTADFARP